MRPRTAEVVMRASASELRYRAHVHHRDQEALLAVDARDGRAVGAARYVRHGHDHESAEVTVAVMDEWQGGGLATELLSRLTIRARSQGIRRFTAVLPADDVRARRLVHKVA